MGSRSAFEGGRVRIDILSQMINIIEHDIDVVKICELKRQLISRNVMPIDDGYIGVVDAHYVARMYWVVGRYWYALRIWVQVIRQFHFGAEDILISAPWRDL